MTDNETRAIVVPVPPGEDPKPPVRPDGSAYRFELAVEGGTRRAYADELGPLVEVVIPGYLDQVGEDQRLAARERDAGRVRMLLQAQLLAHFGPAGCTRHQLAVLNGAAQLAQDELRGWHAPVPLVLVTSGYVEAGGQPPHAEEGGVILWIDPSSEEAYLDSLSALHVIMLAEFTD
ncbi:hypothetical protein AB0K51_34720 [Kitasatospora sp. NPDC049285]|uniref:hypothetical protein n=1 Tax=Kitasatospora sp. NPDC049285 TaxID=3157096 RepID=UPI003431F9E6